MSRHKGQSRAEKRKARRLKREQEKLSEGDMVEQSVHRIMANERTEEVNEEGYHFIRPEWHRYVYGGGKREK